MDAMMRGQEQGREQRKSGQRREQRAWLRDKGMLEMERKESL